MLAGFVIAAGASVALFLPPGGLKEMWNHTIGYQLTRTDIFSIWALHPALSPIKDAVTAFAVILAVLVAFRPRGARTPAQVAALGAAVIIAVQLPALHWFYLYIVVVPAADPDRGARRGRAGRGCAGRGARSR